MNAICGCALESTVNEERPGPTSVIEPEPASKPEFHEFELVS